MPAGLRNKARRRWRSGLRSGPVLLAEAVSAVGDGEGSIRLCGHFEPVRAAVVLRRRRRGRPWRRKRQWRNRNGRLVQVRNESSGHVVLLTSEEGEVNLPEILETW